MKIAFISYEYPPDTADGGTATYVQQAARMLARQGHHVEVFTASESRCGMETETEGIVVHRTRIRKQQRAGFAELVGPQFQQRHQFVRFDVLEGPERFSDARVAVALVPDIPLVITLHCAGFLRQRLRYCLDNLRPPDQVTARWLPTVKHFLRFPRRGLQALRLVDKERLHVLDADEVVSPSRALMRLLVSMWKLDPSRVRCIPLPLIADETLTSIPVDREPTDIVTYVGRLELLKGVLDLARAIPLILRERPQTRFRFVGETRESPHAELTMRQYLEEWLYPYRDSIEFAGKLPRESLPAVLAQSDICVFPSLWENFPMVVVEGMAAGCAVIGSVVGGGREIIDSEAVGRLVSPGRPDKIAQRVLELLADPTLRKNIGLAARERVLSQYNPERIGQMKQSSYESAIRRRKQLGPRNLLIERVLDRRTHGTLQDMNLVPERVVHQHP